MNVVILIYNFIFRSFRVCAYLRGKAAGKQNFGYVKCTTKKDKQKSVHKVKFLMNTRYGRGDRI